MGCSDSLYRVEMPLAADAQDAVDIVGDDGDLALRASSSSVESPGFLAAYSAHVIRPPAAARQHSDEGSDGEASGPPDDTDPETASVERWAGSGGEDPAAQAIKSLQVRFIWTSDRHVCDSASKVSPWNIAGMRVKSFCEKVLHVMSMYS